MPRILSLFPLMMASLALGAPVQNAAPVLPQSFSGWTMTGAPTAPENASDAAVLKEFGVARSEAAHYSLGKNTLSVRAWQF
ncbi:MAG: hypothetical protein WA414_05520, partial [Acidobacteriaceae bacterium]